MKQAAQYTTDYYTESPPHGGVWIETTYHDPRRFCSPGHPLTGGCGLKHFLLPITVNAICHPLTGGCGLKHLSKIVTGRHVRSPPHGGVWIESRVGVGVW